MAKHGEYLHDGKDWEKELQEAGLGMDRGYNSSKITYGWEYRETPTEKDIRDSLIYLKQKRKEENAKQERVCQFCGERFLGRADARCCPRPKSCRTRFERKRAKAWIMSVINKITGGT